jgi:formate dehydrogenase subunit gamma
MARLIQRYRDGERMNHWAVALLFVLAALSGLALFHPSLFFFSHLFGGGSWTRILHPFMGLLMVLLFIGLFFRFRRENRITAEDRAWRAQMGRMIRGDKAGLPAVGKYNYGQKLVFWVMSLCLLVLLVTGFMFWRPWFAPAFPIIAIRIAALLHAIAAFGLVMSVIVHVYAAIWVKGTMRAMTRGTVTDAWARLNHPLWHGEVTRSSR